jgi:hypothetical protein
MNQEEIKTDFLQRLQTFTANLKNFVSTADQQ